MKALVVLLMAAFAVTSCSKESIRGEGNVVVDTRLLTSFTNVQVEGSSVVEIKPGNASSVVVSGYENLVPIYETTVQNGTLVLKFDNQYYNIRNNNIRSVITMPALNEVSLNGSGEITTSGFNGVNFTAEINGSGEISASNSNYQIAKYNVNGSGRINAGSLISKVADVEISGSGRIDLTCTEALNAKISGSGNINYSGSPTTINTQISGSGKVIKK